jgi:PKD repeat protein
MQKTTALVLIYQLKILSKKHLMKKQFTFLVALVMSFVITQTSFAQQANIWYFGDYAGLDFSGPVTPITGGALSTNEGCASICDNTGTLLFYTDGVNVWDATHTVINPGSPLLGSPSSTQSAIIIPKPGSANRYFIFTQDEHGLGTCSNGLNYIEVDVTGGTVTLLGSMTNLLGCSETTEKITAACHANSTDYWAVTVKQNGDFVSWPITSSGVGAAVVSAGMATPCNTSGWPYLDDRVGYMKVSNQGNHIVLARREYNSINEAFDYDNSTGIVTANLGTYHVGTVYGVEFSSDGNYFYTTEDFRNVVQYQIPSIGTSTTIFNSYVSIGALQLAPDGNIYVANGYENSDGFYLDMISNINTYPATYNDDYVALPTGTHSRLGLPDFVSCFVPTQDCNVESIFQYNYNQQNCSYEFYDFSTHGTGTQIVGWQWTFGDGTSSNLQNPVHYYSAPGMYTVCLTVTAFDGTKCCLSTQCVDLRVKEVCNEPCNIHPDFKITIDNCNPCEYNFDGFVTYANREIAAWIWDFGDGNTATGQNATHTYTSSGTFNVCLTVIGRSGKQECCVFKVCKQVQVDCGVRPNPAPSNKNNTEQGKASDAMENGIKAFPNPTSGTVKIEFNAPASQKVTMQLMDYTGKLLWESNNNTVNKGRVTKEIDISNVPSGIYLLRVEGDNLKLTEKIQVIKN